MIKTEQCRMKAEWIKVGVQTSRLPKIVYRIPLDPDIKITECLGAIKPRSDSRWSWWRWKSKFHKGWIEGQGVTANQKAAEIRVLEGWQ